MRIGNPYKRQKDLVDERFDVIIVGSGIGALTTAAFLSKKAGKRVLILERHYTAGGYTHSFRRPGYEWDVGVHYLGEMGPRGELGRRARLRGGARRMPGQWLAGCD